MTPPSDRIRALLVISNLEFGGAQRQVIELANASDASNAEVHVCSLSPYVPLSSELHFPNRLHVVRKYHRFDVTVVPRLVSLIARLRPDVVHGYLFDAEIAVRLAGRLSSSRLVVGSERNTNY